MAENRGGMRPDAPQNNPANVSGTGGAGQNGNYTGFAYGQNKEINQSRIEGNQAVDSVKASTPAPEGPAYSGMNFPQLGTLMDPTARPEEPISAGINFGDGPGEEALPQGFQNNTRPDENALIAKQYLPELVIAARSQDAPDSFKRFVNYLVTEAQG